MDITGTILSHQIEAERLFAGAVMIDDEYARQVCGWLAPEMIHDEKIRAFWTKVLGGVDAHQAALDVQAYYEIASYISRVVSTYEMTAYANTISMDHYLAESGRTLSAMARAIAGRNTDLLRELAQSIAEKSPVAADEIPNAVDIGLEFHAALEDLEMRSERTGITSLDNATGGLEKQTLTILAARPSMGKSALGIQICKWKAEKEGKKVILFSLEMSRRSIWARMVCGELRVPWRDVRARRVNAETLEAVDQKSNELMERLSDRFLVDDTSNQSMDDIWRKVSLYRPDLVVIDHLGLVNSREENEVQALGEISNMSKALAKQFDIPVLMLYQLNRGTEARDNKRPMMSDLRGSGKIEENADNIFFLYRPDYYDEAKPDQQTVSKTELIISKFRDGIRNIYVYLQFHLDEQWFYPEAREAKP